MSLQKKFKEEIAPTKDKALDLHFLPFKVEYDGPAKVQDLFTQTAKKDSNDDSVLKNTFRGRPLQGTRMDLPEDFTGFVAQAGIEQLGGETKIIDQFKSLTYWEWDKKPSSMDNTKKLEDWMGLANVLHAPIKMTE